MDLPGLKRELSPGMSQVVEAGEEYTIVDNNGKELELIGKLDQKTIAFLRAFDMWIGLRSRMGETHELVRPVHATMIEAWNNLGTHARRELQSYGL